MKLRKDAKVKVIREIPLFKHCSGRQLGEIAAIADELDLREGTTLTREGKPGREFFVIVDGKADVLMDDKPVKSVKTGDFFGEIALITGGPRTATVKASSPLHVLVITARDFQRLIERSPQIANKVLLSMAERLAPASS
jgi:CRP/FNR family transcriptional regulator, cyclic AMP receptor protein